MATATKKQSATTTPPWLTISGAAEHTSLSKQSIRRLINDGELRAYRPVPGRILIRTADLDALIEQRIDRRSEQEAS